MSPQTLGYLVFVYAAFTFGAVLSLVPLAFGQGGVDGWTLGDAALWLAWISGGIGLVQGRAWSRRVILAVAAVSVARCVAAMWWLPTSELPMGLGLFVTLTALPPAAIFVMAMRLGPPAAWPAATPPRAPAAGGTSLRRGFSPRVDLAYGCFAWIAVVACGGALIGLLGAHFPIDVTTVQVVGMVIGIPVVMATLAALALAVVLSVIEWRRWPLPVMAAASVSMVVLFLLVDEGVYSPGWAITVAWNGICVAIMVFFCVRWFAFARRRETARDSH